MSHGQGRRLPVFRLAGRGRYGQTVVFEDPVRKVPVRGPTEIMGAVREVWVDLEDPFVLLDRFTVRCGVGQELTEISVNVVERLVEDVPHQIEIALFHPV